MDGNKDAAQRCLAIGNEALKIGDKARAYRFLGKAQRLDPKLNLERLLSSLAEEVTGEESIDSQRPREKVPDKDSSEKDTSSSREGTNRCNGHAATNGSLEYTAEQSEFVRKIRKTKDYYQILGLNKECSTEDVRKAYKKVSLKVHPDKNKAPGSEEAFKAVSKAFACLSDQELRNNYDQYGPEEARVVSHRHRGNGFVYETFDADEIFNSFFFGEPFASSGVQRANFMRSQRAAGSHAGNVRIQEIHLGRWVKLLQLLPILFLFLINFLPSSTPVYSLEQSSPYNVKYLTKEHAVAFFVKSPNFDKEFPPGSSSRRNIEGQVIREYTYILEHNCRRELSHRYWNSAIKTPNCDRLQVIRAY